MTAGQRVRPEELDAVTIDAYGTLLELRDPVAELHRLVPDRSRADVEQAFEAEARYYAAHSQEGRDDRTLALLHADCTRVFNDALGTSLSPGEYVGALRFDVVAGAREALTRLRARGLELAVVANWDYGLHAHLRDHGLGVFFAVVVTCAEAGAKKPDPAPFRIAVDRLAVRSERVLHVGDHAPHDEVGALAAGLRFAPAPLTSVDRGWE